MKFTKALVLVLSLCLMLVSFAHAGKDLDTVKSKGFIQAGVNGSVFGFGMPDDKGNWAGLDVDTARAIAAGTQFCLG